MEPFGMGNPEPVFVARLLRLMAAPRVIKEKHLKLTVAGSQSPVGSRGFQAMGWRMAGRLQSEPLAAQDEIDLAFKVIENSHPEFGGLELSICDFARRNQPQAVSTNSRF
jgi:single-stranded-DNA-specific exonuclease